MNKKIISGILILIILVGAIIIGTIGLNVDVNYAKSTNLYIYFGKTFDNKDVEQMAKEVFETNNVKIQKVEIYQDMVNIVIKQKDIENFDEKLKLLNDKINEKYELENNVEDIEVKYQPKTKLSSILVPYILPIFISTCIILFYAILRYKKLWVIEVLVSYIFATLVPEAIFLSILAITRIPVGYLTIPIGLLIYVCSIIAVTILKEEKFKKVNEK